MELNVENLDMGALADFYITYKNSIEQLEAETKRKIKILKESLEKIGDQMSKKMQEQKIESFRTSMGLIHFIPKTQVLKLDGEAFLEFCKKENKFELMQLTPMKNEVVEYIKTTGVVPPGLEYKTFKDLSVRRS